MMRALLTTLLLAAAVLSGCVDDTTPDDDGGAGPGAQAWTPGPHSHPAYGFAESADLPERGESVTGIPADWRKPSARPLPDEITGLVHEGQVDVGSGSGIALFGSYAYVGQYNASNFWVVDISDPQDPQVVGHTDATTGDVDVIAYPDGRLVAVTATRGADMIVIDVTDPTAPEIISTITTTQGNHNLQVVPGTPILYNAASSGEGGGANDIWDLSDPFNPVHVQDFENGFGCHAIDFHINASKERYLGFCAGIEVTQIWDVTDPLQPEVISTMPFPIGGTEQGGELVGGVAPASFSHLAMPNHDATVLIVGDETGGGAAAGCDAHVELPTGETVSGPLGNLFFYDITDVEDPVLHGAYSPSATEERGGCTAHFGGIVGDRPLIAIAYYTVGVVLVDFSDLDNPREVDIWKPGELTDACTLCGVWDAQYHEGYVFTGDIDRGMDILSFE